MPSDSRQARRRKQIKSAHRSHRQDRERLWLILGTLGVVVIVAAIIVSSAVLAKGGSAKPSTAANALTPTASGAEPVIDGIKCDPQEQVTYHVHAELQIYIHGKAYQIPPFIGIPDNANPSCFYYLHTHSLQQYPSGLIHVEYPHPATPTLKQFLDIWLKTRPDQDQPVPAILRDGSNVHVFVDRKPYSGTPSAITITPHKLITIEIGKPLVTPPKFTFPSGT